MLLVHLLHEQGFAGGREVNRRIAGDPRARIEIAPAVDGALAEVDVRIRRGEMSARAERRRVGTEFLEEEGLPNELLLGDDLGPRGIRGRPPIAAEPKRDPE